MSTFPFTFGIFGNSLPLSANPYWSRITLSQIQGVSASNYSLLAFKPGLPLQASELNEIQEIQSMTNTLTSAMHSSWPVFSSSWTGGNEVYGPGWHGTTPLYPKYDGVNTTENLVGQSGGQIILRRGWYLVTVKSSSLKHWIYSNHEYVKDIPTTQISGSQTNQLGFVATYETIKPAQDPSLYDNSSGSIVPNTGAPAGADRIRVNISDVVWAINGNTANFSPILKKIDNESPLLYMNNVKVPQE